jgi:hypothetical protein
MIVFAAALAGVSRCLGEGGHIGLFENFCELTQAERAPDREEPEGDDDPRLDAYGCRKEISLIRGVCLKRLATKAHRRSVGILIRRP